MRRILFICVEAAAAGIFMVPLILLLNRLHFHSQKRTAVYLLFTLYLCSVWALVGLPNSAYIRFALNVNLIPLAGMIHDLKNSILNVLLFVPLGFLLPLLWKSFRKARQTVLFGLLISGTIELLQILTFRATDVNDLITNTLGSGLGWLLFAALTRKHPNTFAEQDRTDLWILMACVFTVMFFLQPFLSNAIWTVIY